jgi:hypothetical protein
MATAFDPTVMSVRFGVLGAIRWPKASLEFNPAVDINVTEREGGLNEMLYLPVEMSFLAAPRLSLSFQSGVWTYLDSTEFGNSWALPLGFGGIYQVSDLFGLGARFTWPILAGGEGWDYLTKGGFAEPGVLSESGKLSPFTACAARRSKARGREPRRFSSRRGEFLVSNLGRIRVDEVGTGIRVGAASSRELLSHRRKAQNGIGRFDRVLKRTASTQTSSPRAGKAP